MNNDEVFYKRLCHVLMDLLSISPSNFFVIPSDKWHETYDIPTEKLADIDSFFDMAQNKIIFTRKENK